MVSVLGRCAEAGLRASCNWQEDDFLYHSEGSASSIKTKKRSGGLAIGWMGVSWLGWLG